MRHWKFKYWFSHSKLKFKIKEIFKNKVKSLNFKVEEVKTLEIIMIVKIIKYIKEHSTIFDVNMCNNNELNFDVINENNTYFAYLNFTIKLHLIYFKFWSNNTYILQKSLF